MYQLEYGMLSFIINSHEQLDPISCRKHQREEKKLYTALLTSKFLPQVKKPPKKNHNFYFSGGLNLSLNNSLKGNEQNALLCTELDFYKCINLRLYSD